jgi:hypothetical protein
VKSKRRGPFCVAFVGPYREYHGPEDSMPTKKAA